MKLKLLGLILFIFSVLNLHSEDCNSLINNFDKPISLKSGWLFMKGDNPEWKTLELEDTTWAKKTMPDAGRDPNPDITETGFHWYRCRILLPESIKDSSSAIAIHLGKIRDSDEVYFNGNLIGSIGKFPPAPIADFEKERIYSISSKLFQPGLNILSVRIYTSTDFYGIDFIPVLGSEIEINRQNSTKEIFNITFGFVFIAMGLFFILGSIIRSTKIGRAHV